MLFANMCASADLKQDRLLDLCDQYAAEHGLDGEVAESTRPTPTTVEPPVLEADLRPIGTMPRSAQADSGGGTSCRSWQRAAGRWR